MAEFQNLAELLGFKSDSPRVSLYQPTHRHHPENKQDPILFRNLIKDIEASLNLQLHKDQTAKLLQPFNALAANEAFWNKTADGIAVFGADDFFQVVPLYRPTPQLAIVADSFHVKPLLRVLQSADRFHVLALDRQKARLFEGNRDQLDEIVLPDGFPNTARDVIGDELPEAVGRVRSVGAPSVAAPGAATARGTVRYTHGTKSEILDAQTEKFFRAVDRAVIEQYSQPSGVPVILAALPEHHAMFRAVSSNPKLLNDGVMANADSLSVNDLRAQCWKVLEPLYLQRLSGFVDQFHAARNAHQGSADLSDVAVAAVAGRVRVLLLEAERHEPGRINAETGALEKDAIQQPDVDDMLDDLAELVLKNGGEVIIVPAQRMPVDTGLAAIFRF